jgi:hypothetical protein
VGNVLCSREAPSAIAGAADEAFPVRSAMTDATTLPKFKVGRYNPATTICNFVIAVVN